MPAFYVPDDQPDLSNSQAALDTNDLHLIRDMLHASAGNVIRALQAVRDGDREYDGASVRATIANALNLAEASIDSFRAVEAECRQHLAKRAPVRALSVIPPAKPFGRRTRDADLPAVSSPGALA